MRNSLKFYCLIASLWLVSLASYGQALGLAELIRLRSVSPAKAARILRANGWALAETRPSNTGNFSIETWKPAQKTPFDSIRIELELYRSEQHQVDNYLEYWVGPGGKLPAEEIGGARNKKLLFTKRSFCWLPSSTKSMAQIGSGSANVSVGGCIFFRTFADSKTAVTVSNNNYIIYDKTSKVLHF